MPLTIELAVSEDIEPGENDYHIPDENDLKLWAESACLLDDDVVASFQIVSSDEIQVLNKKYRGKDKPTNVLSFPMQLPEEVDIKLLGDLALCADVINKEAKQQAKSKNAHWAHMVVHGMLHLQGHDHINEEEAASMEEVEINILNKLGFKNPYLESHT